MDRDREIFKHDSNIKNRPANSLPDWIEKDLRNSGLTINEFRVEPLISEHQLDERLGFTTIGNCKILDIDGYWIPYPGIPDYHRLKLKQPIDTEKGTVKYLSPKGSANHVYLLPEVRELLEKYCPDISIFICEGEKKAVKATLEGFPSMGLSGVWNFKDSESDFLTELDGFIWKDRTTYIVFDSDISEKHSVKHAELRLAVEFINRYAKANSIRLPSELGGKKNGLDDYLVRYDAKAFRALADQAKNTLELHVTEGTDTNLVLRELPRLSNEITRVKILKSIAKREGVNMDAVEADYQKHLPRKEEIEQAQQETFTPEEMEKAQELLKSPDILERMIETTNEAGVVGEEVNRITLFLSTISRLNSDSLSVIYKGASSSGKSFVAGSVLQMVPKQYLKSFSFLTPKALVHSKRDLSHCVLFIQEQQGGEQSDYSIRTTLSEGEISISIPVKDPVTGNFETTEKRVKAEGLVFIQTTTKDRIHHENQTRVFDLYADDSEDQTKRVIMIEGKNASDGSENLEPRFRVWRCAQALLHGHTVVIPFAEKLAEYFPTKKVRARRDFKRFLSLLSAHCLIYQLQREKVDENTLIATYEDLNGILPIVEKVLEDSLRELSPRHMEVLEVISSDRVSQEFSIGELFEQASNIVSYKTLQRYAKFFVSEGIISWNGESGVKSRYIKSQYSGEVMSSSAPFIFNIHKLLENNRQTSGHDEMSPYDQMSLPDKRSGLKDTLGHSGVSSSKPSNIKQLDGTNGDQDIGTPEFRTLESLDDEFEIPGVIND